MWYLKEPTNRWRESIAKPADTTKPAVPASIEAIKPHLKLDLEVLPHLITVNLIPPVRRPQRCKIGIALNVTNIGTTDYDEHSPDTAIVRFAILRGPTLIWEWPNRPSSLVTPFRLKPLESHSFIAVWEISDAVDFVDVDLFAMARFVPSGTSTISPVLIRARTGSGLL